MKKLIFVTVCAVALGGCGLSKTAPYTPPASQPTPTPPQVVPPEVKATPVAPHACVAADIPVLTAGLDKVNGLITQADTAVTDADAAKADTGKMLAALDIANKALADARAVCKADDVQIDIANCADQAIKDSFTAFQASCDKIK